ncbi:MAG: hypothetical protein RLZZ528_1345 [Pseudomonadota bacterium]|jgi:drug/metabolite transporter (DMT)-like permease
MSATEELGEVPALTGGHRAGDAPLKGVLLVVLAVFLFACMDVTTKYLSQSYAVPTIMAIRYFGNLILLVALLAPKHGMGLVRTQRTGLVVLRGLCLVAGSLGAGLALQRMPVPETMSIVFLAPVAVVFVARPILGERIGLVGWLAALAGFAGVLLIARPGSGLDALGVALALGCAAVTVVFYILTRLLSATETTNAMLFHATLAGAVAFGLMLPWSWGGPEPSALDVALLVAMGAVGGLGHFCFAAAFRYARASLLAPVNYLQIVWGAILAALVFGHVPDGVTVIGMAIIAAAGVAVGLRAHFGRR